MRILPLVTVLALLFVTLIDAKSVNLDDAAISKEDTEWTKEFATEAERPQTVTTDDPDGTITTADQAGIDASAPATNPSPSNGSLDGDVGRDKRYYFYPTWGRRFYWRNRLKLSPWWSSWWDTWDGWYDADVWNRYDWGGLDWWNDFYAYGRFYRSASNATDDQDDAKEDGTNDLNEDKPSGDATSTDASSSSSDDENASRDKRHFIIYPTWGRRFYWRNRLRSSRWWSSWWDSWDGWYNIDVFNRYNWAGLDWWHDFYVYNGRFYRSTSNATTENQDGANEDGSNDLNEDEPPTDATSTDPSSGGNDENASRDKRHFSIFPTWGRRFYWRNRLRSSRWWSSWWDTWDGWYDIDVWNRYNWAGLDWWYNFYMYNGRFYRSTSNATSDNQDDSAKEDGSNDLNQDEPLADVTSTDASSTGSHDKDTGRGKRYLSIYPTWGRRFYWRNRLRSSRWWSNWWDAWDGWYNVDVFNRYNWAGLDWWHDFYMYNGRFSRSASNATTENQDDGSKEDDGTNDMNKDATPASPADTASTGVSTSGSHDEDAGRDKRYYIIYPTWDRRFYWRNRLKNSRWWNNWWDTWDGWSNVGVWDAYDWSSLYWWNDFYYGGRYYRSAADGVGFQLIAEPKSWSDAAKFCAIKRMCLATLTTEEERDATASVSSEVSYWIGGRYEGSHEPASWKWINGQRIKDATWKDIDAVAGAVADLAAGATRRRCLVAEVEENAGEWSHADCGDVKPFLCQTRC